MDGSIPMDRELAMKPGVLLVEDDPASRAFLVAALRDLPLRIEAVASCAEALRSASMRAHALWLVDAHLPDGTGEELLPALQRQRPGTPAIAHTACPSPATHARLRAAGFVEVLLKPLPASALLDCVERWLAPPLAPSCAAGPPPTISAGNCHVPIGVEARINRADPDRRHHSAAGSGADGPSALAAPTPAGLPRWDDIAALAALNGSAADVAALRTLFLAELPDACASVRRAAAMGDDAGLRAVLHRLAASCGFVGAAQLAATVRTLRDEPASRWALAQFEAAAALLVGGRG